MTSIMDRHATDTHRHHECGGAVVYSGTGSGTPHLYCEYCGAFTYDIEATALPSGTDRVANDAAWDAGDERSPDA